MRCNEVIADIEPTNGPHGHSQPVNTSLHLDPGESYGGGYMQLVEVPTTNTLSSRSAQVFYESNYYSNT